MGAGGGIYHRPPTQCRAAMSTKFKDLVGVRFGRLVVTERDLIRPIPTRWLCQCDCGKTSDPLSNSLMSGRTNSCGCLQKERLLRANTTHGLSRTGAYKAWHGIIDRCTNPNFPKYSYYGGRGIRVCERWHSYENFLADMGPRPAGKTIDRYPNNDGHYEPGNCRWATHSEQNVNMRARVRPQSLPPGVYRQKDKFKATIRIRGRTIHLGVFNTPSAASNAFEAERAKYWGARLSA